MLFILSAGIEGSILSVPVHHKYYYIQTPMTWSDAQSYCRSNYVDLATVDTMEEHQTFLSLFGNDRSTQVWLGLSKTSSKSWGWSDGTATVEWRHWDASVNDGDCVWMGPGGDWSAGDCSSQKAFLCSKNTNGLQSYFLNTQPLSWRGAQQFCRNTYTDLVTVKTLAQHQTLLTLAQGNSVWIGLFRDEWVWSDQTSGAFRMWDEWNPDNIGGDQFCADIRLYYLQWDTAACSSSRPFVCYTSTWKTFVKVTLASKLPFSAVKDSLQQQFQARFKEKGVDKVKLSWKSDGIQQKHNGSQTGC